MSFVWMILFALNGIKAEFYMFRAHHSLEHVRNLPRLNLILLVALERVMKMMDPIHDESYPFAELGQVDLVVIKVPIHL